MQKRDLSLTQRLVAAEIKIGLSESESTLIKQALCVKFEAKTHCVHFGIGKGVSVS